MNSRTDFAYAQARLQARHGQRATGADWRRLASAHDLENFLHTAQRTPLRTWTQGLQSDRSSHAIELQLRQRFRNYVSEIAHWLPAPWRSSLDWIRYLPDLPALQHLLNSESYPAWMLDDPVLHELAAATRIERIEAGLATELAPLATAWQQGEPLPEAWLDQWHRLWPRAKLQQQGLVYLSSLLRRFLASLRTAGAGNNSHPQTSLIPGLQYAFRRFSFQPAAACAHLGLIALDLQQLRGELVQRALFEDRTVGLP